MKNSKFESLKLDKFASEVLSPNEIKMTFGGKDLTTNDSEDTGAGELDYGGTSTWHYSSDCCESDGDCMSYYA